MTSNLMYYSSSRNEAQRELGEDLTRSGGALVSRLGHICQDFDKDVKMLKIVDNLWITIE